MNTFFNLAITVVIAVIGWFVLVYVGNMVGVPAEIVKLCGILLFLYVAWQFFLAIKTRSQNK